jgi:hypothetical protein
MIWWIGAGFLYLFVMAGICIFFKGASIYDRTMEDYERQLLSLSESKRRSDFQKRPSLHMGDILPSLY